MLRHVGIATQLVVERMLASEGIKRVEMGRDEFTKKKYGSGKRSMVELSQIRLRDLVHRVIGLNSTSPLMNS